MDNSLQIVETKNKKCVEKCIICQKVKDNKGIIKLTSTPNGRTALIECSNFYQDNLLEGVEKLDEIKYHVNTCLSNYVKKKKRAKNKRDHDDSEEKLTSENEASTSKQSNQESRSRKRLKSDCSITEESTNFKKKPCIVCNQIKSKSIKKKFRICEAKRAKLFLSAIKYNKDDVYTRCSLLQNIGDVYAADIIYHKHCLTNYLRNFEREIEELLNPSLTELEKRNLTSLFKEFVATINIENKACALSDCRDQFEEYLVKSAVDKGLFRNNFLDQSGQFSN